MPEQVGVESGGVEWSESGRLWVRRRLRTSEEALVSKFLSLSIGIFCQQIPEYEVQIVFLQMRKLRDHAFLVYHHKLKTDVGGNEDEPDQDPMVPSSRAVMFPGLLSQRREGGGRIAEAETDGLGLGHGGGLVEGGGRRVDGGVRPEKPSTGFGRRRRLKTGRLRLGHVGFGCWSRSRPATSGVGIVVGVELAGPVEARVVRRV
ncbi:hypothetical protein M5K25_005914 [Dendrobium thyrsiflorum]|uniref:Uncharacterized protein n=1 Tax=Dendrobium thyrsiflorum TaxID=117978 RepID=A0ABD0VA75_DENTH